MKLLSQDIRVYENKLKIKSIIPWLPADNVNEIDQIRGASKAVYFRFPNTVKLFCSECNRIEPFNPHGGITVVSETRSGSIYQVFMFTYHCQSCKGVPEVFLVRRKDQKLSLMGRCPMEIVQVPDCIPKSHKKYYSDAIVAYNSGQTLPGLFLLRTMIEQYAIKVSEPSDLPADKIIDLYMDKLPEDFKSRFPSLRKIYGDLSAAIHSANDSDELFLQSMEEIKEHFDAKRVFKIV